MINTNNFFNFLNRNGIKFFSGVPDSILKSTRSNLEKKNGQQHIITANEGSAIASCAGYFLSTGKLDASKEPSHSYSPAPSTYQTSYLLLSSFKLCNFF